MGSYQRMQKAEARVRRANKASTVTHACGHKTKVAGDLKSCHDCPACQAAKLDRDHSDRVYAAIAQRGSVSFGELRAMFDFNIDHSVASLVATGRVSANGTATTLEERKASCPFIGGAFTHVSVA